LHWPVRKHKPFPSRMRKHNSFSGEIEKLKTNLEKIIE